MGQLNRPPDYNKPEEGDLADAVELESISLADLIGEGQNEKGGDPTATAEHVNEPSTAWPKSERPAPPVASSSASYPEAPRQKQKDLEEEEKKAAQQKEGKEEDMYKRPQIIRQDEDGWNKAVEDARKRAKERRKREEE